MTTQTALVEVAGWLDEKHKVRMIIQQRIHDLECQTYGASGDGLFVLESNIQVLRDLAKKLRIEL